MYIRTKAYKAIDGTDLLTRGQAAIKSSRESVQHLGVAAELLRVRSDAKRPKKAKKDGAPFPFEKGVQLHELRSAIVLA